MIIWLDVPWNPNRMMYAIVKWSRPFFASIAKCGSMAQHSGILGRSIGWIRPGCRFEDVRRVEMGWDGFFVSPNDFHHCQHEPPKPIGRVNVQLADFVVFPHHFTMILKMLVLFESMSIHSLGHFNHTEVGWSRDWQEAPQSGATRSGQLQRIVRETLSRSIFLWRVPLGANGCHFCIFLSCFRASMKILGSLKKATITRQGVFLGIKKACMKSSLPNGHLKGDKWVTHSDTSNWHKWWHNSWNSAFICKSSNSWRIVLVPRPMTRKVRWWMRENMQATWRLVIVLDTKHRSLKWSCDE